jgi:small subunit ribosomal protein S6
MTSILLEIDKQFNHKQFNNNPFMKNYELLYIVPNQYTDDEADKIKEKVDSMLKSHGAELGLQENMGKKKLAYPIDHVAHGYYFLTEFKLEDGTKIQEINNFLRLDKEILRAQVIDKKPLSPAEIEKLKKREAYAAKNRNERADKQTSEAKPVKSTDTKKVDMKDLDEKLEEILKTDDLV